ncbi:helix-turn-helix domain-containing protein [Paracoccus sp. YIM 132242]|uniref:Helix-turn-helix domain-containing protein n=1 Tax=Paracoccus lichenicola TaxID=2665644 RepID=A0A6L6HQY1_9RHOB|nr:AraC family transcriptional regulator [Paracoccus lichenicola]MTE01586.1 helix-turn-helix domain-containing protein [Paracoccus lichenicola]
MDQRQFWRRSDSLEEFEATMSGLLRPCRVEGRARTRYRTEVLHGRLDRVGLTSVSLGGPAQVRVSAEKGISLLQVPLRGGFAATDRRGATRHFSQGAAAQIVAPDAPVLLEFQPGTRMLIVDLGPQQLEAMGGAALFSRIARDRPAVALTSGAAARMLRLLTFLLAEIEMQQADAPADAAIEAAMEQALVAVIGAMLDGGRADLRPAAADPGPDMLRRAEAFMAAHLDLDLTPARIAEAAGTSLRSLHRAFRVHRGTTPLTALKAMRLDRARAEIEAGRIGGDGLTGLAMRCGFGHMGLFAADYRQRFGVLPSRMAQGRQRGGLFQD